MDYIRDKVILRTALASIVPSAIYVIGYSLSKLFGKKLYDFDYELNLSQSQTCLFLLGAAILNPLKNFSLYLLFGPIEYFLDSKLYVDPKKNYILNGNFAPV